MDNGLGDIVPPYKEQFPAGSRVRVKPRSFLERFQREWKYHHPVSNEQLDFAGVTDTAKVLVSTTAAMFSIPWLRPPVLGMKSVWKLQSDSGRAAPRLTQNRYSTQNALDKVLTGMTGDDSYPPNPHFI